MLINRIEYTPHFNYFPKHEAYLQLRRWCETSAPPSRLHLPSKGRNCSNNSSGDGGSFHVQNVVSMKAHLEMMLTLDPRHQYGTFFGLMDLSTCLSCQDQMCTTCRNLQSPSQRKCVPRKAAVYHEKMKVQINRFSFAADFTLLFLFD